MANERVDIVVTDKVSPGPAKKLRAIASEALKADSAVDRLKASIAAVDASALTRLANASAKLTNAQARETSATARLTNARAKMVGETQKAALAAQRLATEQARTEAATERAAAAASRARSALIQEASASNRLAAAKLREASAQNVATGAANRASTASRRAARGAGLAAHQTQNLIFQVNDVVVGLASGQKPMTVLLQQGSQISTVFGPGTGVTAIMRGLGSAILSIAKQFAPVIIAVGIVAGVFAGLTYEIGQSTDVAVGMGDVFKASLQLIAETIMTIVQPAFAFLGPYVQKIWNFIIATTKFFINGIIGYWVFAKDAIVIAWNGIPAAIGSVVISAVNITIQFIEDMVNKAISLINGLILEANKIGELVGISIGTIASASIGRIENVYEGAGERLGSAIAEAATSAFTRDYAGEAFEALRVRSIALAEARIAKEAEEAAATNGGNAALTTKQKLLQEILKPLVDYTEQSAALNELLNEGVISLGQYSQALASLSLVESLRDLDTGLVGTPFADAAALDEIRIAEQERLNIVQQALEARIINEQEAADRIVAISRQSAQDIQAIEAARNSMILTGASDTFGSLADAAKGFAGEQSGIYKALFITSKAFAIADSIMKIQQGIANALSLPFPANLAAAGVVAANAASIVSSIQAVQFKRDGGEITGPGGPRDDRVPIMASNKEFIVNARDAQRNLPLLRAINAGRDANTARPAFRDGGQVQQAFRAPVSRSEIGSVGNSRDKTGQGQTTVNVFTRDPNTRIEVTNTQRAAATARAVNRGQRNL